MFGIFVLEKFKSQTYELDAPSQRMQVKEKKSDMIAKTECCRLGIVV